MSEWFPNMVKQQTNDVNSRKGTMLFPSTMWTDVLGWKSASIEKRQSVLERFYNRYRLPLLAFIEFQGHARPEAEDLLQEFILHQIDGKIFAHADPQKGRFRNLLLTSLKNFIVSSTRSSKAEKRHPKRGFSYLDEEVSEGVLLKDIIADTKTPEDIFHRIWFVTLLASVMSQLKLDYQTKGQETHFNIFERRVIKPIFHGGDRPSVKALAQEYGLSSTEASNYIVTAKRGYQRHLKEAIKEYSGTEKEASEEINDFLYFVQNLRCSQGI